MVEENGSGFTNKEIITEVRGLREVMLSVQGEVKLISERLNWTRESLESHTKESGERHADFEKRIRKADAWRNALPVALVILVCSVAIGLFALFKH
jgi:hypothetical protein